MVSIHLLHRKTPPPTSAQHRQLVTIQQASSWICRIVHSSVYYSNNIFGAYAEDQWECETRNQTYVIQNPPIPFLEEHANELTLGHVEVEFEATLLLHNNTLVLAPNTSIRLCAHRQLQPQTDKAVGRRRVLVVSMSTPTARSTYAAAELYPFVFGRDQPSLVTQFEACSGGMLLLEPIFGGVVDVLLSKNDYANELSAANEALQIMETTFEVARLARMVDHILFCLPPGMVEFTASASGNHYRSMYNNRHCARLSVLMHEIGYATPKNEGHSRFCGFGCSRF
jgi:hypothetical protein